MMARKPSLFGYERTGSRESARAAELSRRAPHRLAGFLAVRCVVNPARARTDNFALRAGPTSCDGPEPDRGLAAETSHPALYQCDPADVRALRCDHHYNPLRDSASDQTKPGTGAKCTKRLAGHSGSHRIAHKKLSRSSRGLAAHG